MHKWEVTEIEEKAAREGEGDKKRKQLFLLLLFAMDVENFALGSDL